MSLHLKLPSRACQYCCLPLSLLWGGGFSTAQSAQSNVERVKDLVILHYVSLGVLPKQLKETGVSQEGKEKKTGVKNSGQKKDTGQEKETGGDKEQKDKSEGKDKKEQKDKAEDEAEHKPARYLAIGQATWMLQNLFRFHSPYSGESSLRATGQTQVLHTYTGFLGAKIANGLEVFVNPELALGNTISRDRGTGSSLNGEARGQGELHSDPYLARYFLRWRVATGSNKEADPERVGRSENLIPGDIPSRRLVISLGKIEYADVFDANSYANDARTQFLNDALNNNAAYDAGSDTRGYTGGLTIAWINPEFGVRLGFLQMPTEAGGANLSGDLEHSRGDQLEVDIHPRLMNDRHRLATLRLLAFRNFANMGSYQEAVAQMQSGQAPDVAQVRHRGAVKFGYGINLEQPLADGGNTGLFTRYGWSNGATESVAFADVDRTFSFGGQLSGARWRRPDDRFGLAIVQNDISAAHHSYLSAGGISSSVGDGKINYGSEQIMETYYAYHLSKPLTVSLDYQYINHPGYNRDRGFASLLTLRLHAEF